MDHTGAACDIMTTLSELEFALPERRNLIAADVSNEAGDCFEQEFHGRWFVCAEESTSHWTKAVRPLNECS